VHVRRGVIRHDIGAWISGPAIGDPNPRHAEDYLAANVRAGDVIVVDGHEVTVISAEELAGEWHLSYAGAAGR
jgi:hypothetical protein